MSPDGVDHGGMQDSLDAFLDDLRAAASDVPAPEPGETLLALFRDGTVPTAAPAAPRRHRRGLRVAIAGAVVGVTFGGLGVAGALPAGLQEKMADVADVVGIKLPHSEPVLLEETEDAVTTTTSTSTTSSTTSSTPGTSNAPGAPGGPSTTSPGGGTTPAPLPVPGPPAATPPVTEAPGRDGTAPGQDDDRPGNSENAPGHADDDDEDEDERDDEKGDDKARDKDKPKPTTTTTTTTKAPRVERRDGRPTDLSSGVSPASAPALATSSPRTTSNED